MWLIGSPFIGGGLSHPYERFPDTIFARLDFLKTYPVDPPAYGRLPGFEFNLTSLFDASAGVHDLKLNVTSVDSVNATRHLLREKSRLDPSQADAVIDALTREVALIQG